VKGIQFLPALRARRDLSFYGGRFADGERVQGVQGHAFHVLLIVVGE
jgi:hypothetical protein